MIPAIQPIKQQAYTNKGNEYTESNIGKFAAGTAVAATGAVYGTKKAVEGAKTIYNKAKIVKANFLPKSGKKITVQFGQNGASIIVEHPKTAKEIFKNFASAAANKLKNIKNSAVKTSQDLWSKILKFPKAAKEKITANNIKNTFSSAVAFVKAKAKNINMENMKKIPSTIAEFAKKPIAQKAAKIAVISAGVVAAGFWADFIINKISAHKADKNA